MILLFRAGTLEEEEELAIASKYFSVVRNRAKVLRGSLVVGRYSTLPYYNELVLDLACKGSRLVNSSEQHSWIADFHWYREFKDETPETWTEREFPSSSCQGPFILKGTTNSRKQRWKTHMFAQTRQDAIKIACELAQDPFIGQQGIVYRQYEQFKQLDTDPISHIPIIHEFRCFFYGETLLVDGFYWTNTEHAPEFPDSGRDYVRGLAKTAAKFANFFVLDVAQKEDGTWRLIEINDGQQAGLSGCDPDDLYRELIKAHVLSLW